MCSGTSSGAGEDTEKGGPGSDPPPKPDPHIQGPGGVYAVNFCNKQHGMLNWLLLPLDCSCHWLENLPIHAFFGRLLSIQQHLYPHHLYNEFIFHDSSAAQNERSHAPSRLCCVWLQVEGELVSRKRLEELAPEQFSSILILADEMATFGAGSSSEHPRVFARCIWQRTVATLAVKWSLCL